MPLTKQEREQISNLRVGIDGIQASTLDGFLREFRAGHSNSADLVGELLGDAITSTNPDDVELSMLIGFRLGFEEVHVNFLSSLAHESWHYSHEDIASALDEIRAPGCINSLQHLAQWVPDYLEFDEARALGSKAVWALKKIGGTSARSALRKIAESQKDIVGELAHEKLLELS